MKNQIDKIEQAFIEFKNYMQKRFSYENTKSFVSDFHFIEKMSEITSKLNKKENVEFVKRVRLFESELIETVRKECYDK